MKQKHVIDWEKASSTKGYSAQITAEGVLQDLWYQTKWSTVIYGAMVQGDLCKVRCAPEVFFTIKVPHGNKTLYIEGPYEDFAPMEETAHVV